MGLLATLFQIIFLIACIFNLNGKGTEAGHYSIFMLGIALICFAIEKNKSQTERENND